MKSSFELAMERLGGLKNISEKMKKKIAETESKFKAKIAAIQITAEGRIKSAADIESAKKIKASIAEEISSLNEKCEQEKNKIRNEK
jgi:hypothetical protein